MSTQRFYVGSATLKEGLKLELPPEISHQVLRVFRMREQDRIVLFDGRGGEWIAEIESIDGRAVIAVALEHRDNRTEPTLQVSVYQALVPAERMEYVVQKSTELGVARIVPVVTERVQARDAKVSEKKLERWRRIATEASEQSGRTRVPEIVSPLPLTDCIADALSRGPLIMLWEEERERSLEQAVHESLNSEPGHVSVLIGPVGGFSRDEAEAARSSGAITAGAGPRILRAETAPVVALTALMYEAGELG